MRHLFTDLTESFRIALSQIHAHPMRSVLTALGVIIGIVAVTRMGSAIGGIEIGFERSLAVIGDDVFYLEKWPWHNVDDWWNYRNRRRMEPHYADDLKRIIAATPNSQLVTAVPTVNTVRNVNFVPLEVRTVFTQGTTNDFLAPSTPNFPPDPFITITNSPDTSIRVKCKDKNNMDAARDELTGAMRGVRGLRPEQKDDFSINEQQALRSTIGPIKAGIAIAGLFVTGLALFVGAIGIMNITYVSVKERTREIGTRKALGAQRRTILMQFLVEAVSICLIGGGVGLGLSYGMCLAVAASVPSFPMEFSFGLVLVGMIVSTVTGIVSGFAPALSASRLDPVEALPYE